MQPIPFGIIGGGWRAEFYIRIAKALPHLFEITGVYLRDPSKREAFTSKWDVHTPSTIDEFKDLSRSAFVVLSVSKIASAEWLIELSKQHIPVLMETPPATDIDALTHLLTQIPSHAQIQVAEQYPFQPQHQARLAFIQSGKLGMVTQAQVSAAHGYHGISLLRRYLSIGNLSIGNLNISIEPCTIIAQRFTSPVIEGPYRGKFPDQERMTTATQDIAWLQFDSGKWGVFDFTRDQYFSPIRKGRILIRGTKGEIKDNDVYYMKDFQSPVEQTLKRIIDGGEGSLERLSLARIVCGEDVLYHNPFHPVSLSDEEIAMADLLIRMNRYVQEGVSFYSLTDAVQDTYLSLLIEESIAKQSRVRADFQSYLKGNQP